jgi:4-carboxymuconolactone decarboxylase
MKEQIAMRIVSIFVLCLAFAFGVPAMAQDRMPSIPPDKLTDAQKKAIQERNAAQLVTRAEACRDPKMDQAKCSPTYFEVHGPMVPLLRSPDVMVAANALDNYLEFKSVLPPEIREFVILITAREWTQQYVWNSHYTNALKNGLSPEIVKAVADGRRPTGMSEAEETVYDFCEELKRNRAVSDATYASALAKFGEQGVIEIVSIDGCYSFLSMVMNVARTPVPKTATAPPLASLPH